MKKIVFLLLIGILYAFPSLADTVYDGLPASVDNSLKAHTRAMIAIGVDARDGLNMTRAMLQNQYQREQIIQAQKQ
jgi:hypothetical protein